MILQSIYILYIIGRLSHKIYQRLCHGVSFVKLAQDKQRAWLTSLTNYFPSFTRVWRNTHPETGFTFNNVDPQHGEKFADKYWIKFVIEIGGDTVSDVVIDMSHGRRWFEILIRFTIDRCCEIFPRWRKCDGAITRKFQFALFHADLYCIPTSARHVSINYRNTGHESHPWYPNLLMKSDLVRSFGWQFFIMETRDANRVGLRRR